MAKDESGRRKAYVSFRDPAEKRQGAPVLRTLLALAYQRGEAAARKKEPLPPSFVELFGPESAVTRRVMAGEAGAFDPFSDGGALRRRETVLLQHLGGAALGSTARLKESVVAEIACIVSLPNPADAAEITEAEPEKKA